LASFADHATKESCPGEETIAKRLGLKYESKEKGTVWDVDAVRTCLRKLVSHGVIVNTKRRHPIYRTTIYCLPMHPDTKVTTGQNSPGRTRRKTPGLTRQNSPAGTGWNSSPYHTLDQTA
jgi:hypothetical protein